MSLSINASKINLFDNMNINKTQNYFKDNNTSNEKTDKNKTNSITLKDNTKKSSLMDNLLKQKDSLTEKKQAIMEKELDPEDKKAKLEDINKQIQDIEAQIQQLNIQEKQEEVQKKDDEALKKKVEEQEKNPPKQNQDEVRDDIIISASLNELIKINSSKESIHLMKDSKNRQIVEAGYIKPNDDPNSYNNRRLAQISRSLPNLDAAISRTIGDLNKSAERIKYKTKLAKDELENKEIENKKDNETIENKIGSKENDEDNQKNIPNKDKVE